MRVVNWSRFQHYAKRSPPWIRLYRTLLDNLEFAKLSDKSQAVLVQIWLLASESDNGTVKCDLEMLRFRTRRSNLKTEDLKPLFDNGFLCCASEAIASCTTFQNGHSVSGSVFVSKKGVAKGGKQAFSGYPEEFSTFWKNYPKKEGKGKALEAMTKISGWKSIIPDILAALEWQTKSEQWTRDNGQFIPHPATYLNQRRWEDEPVETTGKIFNPSGRDANGKPTLVL